MAAAAWSWVARIIRINFPFYFPDQRKCEDDRTSSNLSGEDVAGAPRDIGAQLDQGLDQDGGLVEIILISICFISSIINKKINRFDLNLDQNRGLLFEWHAGKISFLVIKMIINMSSLTWTVMCRHPAILAPFNGLEGPYFCLRNLREILPVEIKETSLVMMVDNDDKMMMTMTTALTITYMSPGISFSARVIVLRPQSAKEMSATLYGTCQKRS